ncbi:MAG: single-stranded-DNA-specific exonuclease RecJ [Candidatus Thiodiazotropha sp.]
MTEEINIRQRPVAVPGHLAPELHSVLRRVYAARGVSDDRELELGLARMAPVSGLKGVSEAAELLHEHISDGSHILIVGDYDADGATSTALAVLALRAFGARKVSYLVPNRFEYGYGLTPEIVALAASRNPDLIVTVDNGISSLKGVDQANRLGIPVLITDHHLPGRALPAARVIVNPNQPGDDFSSPCLAGVGVIFYVMAALFNRLDTQGWFDAAGRPRPAPAEWLDLVALGTISDLVPLDHNNRILVSQGLKRIRAGRCRPGILALLEVSRRTPQKIVSADIGFAVGPRLNAAGRLDDMSLGIECLLSESADQARIMAAELDRLNQLRRALEQEMKTQAEELLTHSDDWTGRHLPQGLCLFDERWHQGVTGILASRIKDQYHRPVIAFADAGEGVLKGSARSIPGLHMRDLLDLMASREPQLISRFGGHAMAAGLSLERSAFERFRECFEQTLAEQLDPDLLEGVILTDGTLGSEDLNLDLAQQIREAGPWGQGFPEPLFEGRFAVLQQRVVGESHLQLVLGYDKGHGSVDAIAFNQPRLAEDVGEIRVTYRLNVNDFRNRLSLQLIVETIQSIPKMTN